VGRQELEIIMGKEHISFTVPINMLNVYSDIKVRLICRGEE